MRYFLFGFALSLLPLQAHAITPEEGLLYSAIGCTSLYKKLERPEASDSLLNLIHHYSERENITSVQSGYVTRFIKLVERKWEKENALARQNCEGLLGMAAKETKPDTYNDLTITVLEYLSELEKKKRTQ